MEISRQVAKARSREARRKSAVAATGIGDVEKVRDLIVNGQKPLSLTGRFEARHDPLASPRRLMRILGPIVESFVLAMFDV